MLDSSDTPAYKTTQKLALNIDVQHATASPSSDPGIPVVGSVIKPIVIGVYGISGSGKSTLLEKLKKMLGEDRYLFHEGTTAITSFFQGADGLDRFRALTPEDKTRIREMAIRKVAKEAAENKKIAIVTGHFMFWSDKRDEGDVVWTQADLETYTHVIYLDLPEAALAMRRGRDETKKREFLSEEQLRKWKCLERDDLRSRCFEAGTLFTAIRSSEAETVASLVNTWVNVTEELNGSLALKYLDGLFVKADDSPTPEIVLMIDADKTLTVEDTGNIFWTVARSYQIHLDIDPLNRIFSGKGGYSFEAFRQAALLYGELDTFDDICAAVANRVKIYPEFIRMLQYVTEKVGNDVKILVVTCGMARVWEAILHNEYGLKYVDVIGGGRHSDGFIVTPGVKAALVSHLQGKYRAFVWAFGDSPLDLGMLSRADNAIVVVGPEESRSRSMEAALLGAIVNEGLQARQVLVGNTTRPRIDTSRLPVIRLDDQDFLDEIVCGVNRTLPQNVIHLTDTPAAKLLMTSTRDSSFSGPDLRDVHEEIGRFLAIQCLTGVVGLEERDIPHVQGKIVAGYNLCNEAQTSIVALMRGGEPMAFGVNKAFRKASFVHAKYPRDLRAEYVLQQKTLILVDSVVNSGKSVVEFVEHIRTLREDLPIVVVAGVVQEQAVLRGKLYQLLVGEGEKLKVVALRLSKNKFTGKGGTDTGNRLFNTTWLD